VNRYFLALLPDAVARAAMAALIPAGVGRPVHSEDLHLTLAFLGDLRVRTSEVLLDTLAAVTAGRGPVEVVLDRVEIWPGPRAACAVGEAPGAAVLAAALWQCLSGCGYAADIRPFRAHVTLARGLPRTAEAGVNRLSVPVTWTSHELALLASAPEPGTPRYRVLGVRSFG